MWSGSRKASECFDWGENAWRAVHIAEGEALVFAGELFPFVCGQDVALSHRVVLPMASKGAARWSLPFELLPVPCPAVAQEINRLGTGLVSANY
jgi:isopenicillin N synthase-like dioxygenase